MRRVLPVGERQFFQKLSLDDVEQFPSIRLYYLQYPKEFDQRKASPQLLLRQMSIETRQLANLSGGHQNSDDPEI